MSRDDASAARNRRAGRLADRIEEGAHALAAFAEGITAEEWKRPVSKTDSRTIGVIVDHVANMYPIEVDAARVVAGGKAFEVGWDAVAGVNAQHATEKAGVTKEAAIERLRKNSRDAAAPFALSYGAPMTAQFVIEDHAMRHAWHHLFRIRKALGERLFFLHGQVGEPIEGLEPAVLALPADEARTRDPVGLLAVDQVADDVVRAPSLRALVRARPGLGQSGKESIQDAGSAPEDRHPVSKIEVHGE